MALTASDFHDPLLRVLYTLSNGQAGVPVPCQDTYAPCLQIMGISDPTEQGIHTESGQPMTYKWIQWANKNLAGKNLTLIPSRGQWALTPNGLLEAMRLVGGHTMNPNSTTTNPTGVSLTISKGVPDTYHPDPYMRALAAAQTPCFGHFSDQAPTCRSCGIQGSCIAAMAAEMATLADTLRRQDEAEARKAKEDASKAQTRQTVLDQVQNTAPTSNHPALRRANGELITNKVAIKCSVCNKVIEKHKQCLWIKGVKGTNISGLFHLECVPE